MNILHALHQLLGQGERAANSFQGSNGNHVRFANPTGVPAPVQPHHQAPSRPIPLQMRGRTEDSQMVQSAQGFTPMNADVAHFQGAPNAQGGQFNPGYSPLQATNSFGGGMLGVQPRNYGAQVQFGQGQGGVNPQMDERNGFFYY